MLTEERRQKIEQIVRQKKRVRVRDISGEFDISEVTIRKDLEILEKRGVLSRVHGGAILNGVSVPDLALNEKALMHRKEKERIACRAVEMIEPGDVVILDSGSTATQIARQIKFKSNIKVVTNAINIASELAGSEIEVILSGGMLRDQSFSLVGPFAEDLFRSITADRLFLGVDGIHFAYGLTTPNILEARVNQLMMKAARETVLVADASKFGRRSLGVICGVGAVDTIITDRQISEEDLAELKLLGLNIIVA